MPLKSRLFQSIFQQILGNFWQRHLLKKGFSRFTATLLGLYALYILIDLSLNYGKHLYHLSMQHLISHYLFDILKRLPQIAPFALTLTVATQLLSMHRQKESIAIQMAGTSIPALVTPFIRLALLLGALILGIYEGLFFNTIPLDSYNKVNIIPQNTSVQPLRGIALSDHLDQWLIFETFDPRKSTFKNALLIDSENTWHFINDLKIMQNNESKKVTNAQLSESITFSRSSIGKMVWSKNPSDLVIPLSLDLQQLLEDTKLSGQLNMYEIITRLCNPFPLIERNLLHALLYYRLVQPLHCINAVLIALFWTVRRKLMAQRTNSYAFTLIKCLVSLAIYNILFQAGLLLASSGLCSPLHSILAPALIIPCILLLRALLTFHPPRLAWAFCFLLR